MRELVCLLKYMIHFSISDGCASTMQKQVIFGKGQCCHLSGAKRCVVDEISLSLSLRERREHDCSQNINRHIICATQPLHYVVLHYSPSILVMSIHKRGTDNAEFNALNCVHYCMIACGVRVNSTYLLGFASAASAIVFRRPVACTSSVPVRSDWGWTE